MSNPDTVHFISTKILKKKNYSVMNLDDLMIRGLYLSDISLHDATRELLLVGEQFKEDYKLAQNLEILTDKLQHTLVAREKEKKMTDK